MSHETKAAISWWVEIIWKVGTPLALLALFWLKGTFATHGEVQAVADRVGKIETALSVMAEQNKVNHRQDETLRDHEIRIRTLERPSRP